MLLENGGTVRKLGHWSFVLEEDAGAQLLPGSLFSRPSQNQHTFSAFGNLVK